MSKRSLVKIEKKFLKIQNQERKNTSISMLLGKSVLGERGAENS